MSLAEDMHAPACPACVAGPPPVRRDDLDDLPGAGEAARVLLHVPGAHCAACISTVERALEALPGVRSARLNLTRKRAVVEADPARVSADDMIRALRDVGYEAMELDPGVIGAAETDRRGRELLLRLGVAGFAMMNVMLLSISVWAGAEGVTRDFLHWVSAAIALPAVAFSAVPFFSSAWSALRVGRLNMDVPISLAILLASGLSLWETAHSGAHAYFDAALSLTFFLLAGRWLDHRTRAVARSAARELAALEVPKALRILPDGRRETVPAAELAPGDRIEVLPGAGMPTDGRILTGRTEIDRSMLTGETIPVDAGAGDAVHAGEINLSAPIEVEVTARAAESTLARIAEMVATAENARNRYTSLADRAARIYAPGVHGLAALAFLGWMAAGAGVVDALRIAIATLIITCPCALGLAVPAVSTAATGRLFRRGILLTGGTALERLAEVDTVLFDKTGTLTEGRPELIGAEALPEPVLALAAALAAGSAHPLARAIAEAAERRGVAPVALQSRRELPGLGIEGEHGGARLRLGRAEWVAEIAGSAPQDADAEAQDEPAEGPEVWLVRAGGRPLRLRFRDRLRPGIARAVAALRRAGLELALISGDRPAAVEAVARQLGIERWQAGVRPEDKLAEIERLKAEGRRVLMLGDGLNDAAALAAAHASAAPGSALDAARTAADAILTGAEGPARLPELIAIARAARRRVLENFALAALYNAVSIPLALAGMVTPLIAAIAMSSSSIVVTLNAIRLPKGLPWPRSSI